ncbi:hypothetical protein ACQY0O_000817 [Thecaphora frezii]
MSLQPGDSTQALATRSRNDMEMYAQALKARIELATFKAINGLGKVHIDELERDCQPSPSTRAVAPSSWQLPRPAPKEDSTTLLSRTNSNATVGPSSGTRTSPPPARTSTSTRAARPQRSLYADIFGEDFAQLAKTANAAKSAAAVSSKSPASPAKQSSLPKLRLVSQSSPSSSRYKGNSALLYKAASSPQLGSPQRKDGHFDWHNNPTPEMKAREQELAASGHHFDVLSALPMKRIRFTPTSVGGALLNSPQGAQIHSHDHNRTPSFLPNGHPASSLAQGLGISTPRIPRSCHSSVLKAHPLSESHGTHQVEQDQVERDRVASTLAMMAESWAATREGERLQTSPNVEPHTVPVTPRTGGFAVSDSIARLGSDKRGPNLATTAWENEEDGHAASPRPKTPERRPRQVEDDEGAAHYLLYFASSPSPAGVTRVTSQFQGATPSLHPANRGAPVSSAEPCEGSALLATGARDGAMTMLGDHSSPSATAKRRRESDGNLPITPPPSGRTRHQRNPLEPSDDSVKIVSHPSRRSGGEAVHFGSPPRTPPRTAARLPDSREAATHAPVSDLYGWAPGAPTTPPPQAPSQPHTPQAPGTDFSYADFVNVSPSPKPRSVRRTPRAGTGGALERLPVSVSGNDATPSRGVASRARFLDLDEDDWKNHEWNTTLTPGPSPNPRSRLATRSPRTVTTGWARSTSNASTKVGAAPDAASK